MCPNDVGRGRRGRGRGGCRARQRASGAYQADSQQQSGRQRRPLSAGL